MPSERWKHERRKNDLIDRPLPLQADNSGRQRQFHLLWWQALRLISPEEGPSELVCQSRIVVGSENHTRFETQRGIRKRFHHYTLGANANGGFGEDGHANVLRYQVNRLLSRNNIVHVFRSDSLASCCVQNCVTNDGVNSPRK